MEARKILGTFILPDGKRIDLLQSDLDNRLVNGTTIIPNSNRVVVVKDGATTFQTIQEYIGTLEQKKCLKKQK